MNEKPRTVGRTTLALAMAIITAACAPVVQLDHPDVRLPAAFETATGDANSALSLDQWWDDFHDGQLSALVADAFAHSTTARLAYTKIVEARGVRAQSRATTLPTGNIAGNLTDQGTRAIWGTSVDQPGYPSGFAGFSPSWEIDLFGRLAQIRRRADLTEASAKLDFYGTHLALAADVATDLFQARLLAAQLADAQESLQIAGGLARSATLGEARGLTSTQNAAQLRADAASAEAQVTAVAANLQISKRQLLILTGNPIAPTASLDISATLAAPPAVPDQAPGILLTRRPDVLAAAINLQSASLTIGIDRLALFPRFSLSASGGLSGTGSSAAALLPGGGTGVWSLAAGLALPVLDRPALTAQLRISEARGQQAVVRYEQAVQAAYGEAEDALALMAADRLRVDQLDRATKNARIAFDAARTGYAAGLTDLTTLLQVERSWLQDRSLLNGARSALLIDTVGTIRAFGGGWRATASAEILQPQSPATGTR